MRGNKLYIGLADQEGEGSRARGLGSVREDGRRSDPPRPAVQGGGGRGLGPDHVREVGTAAPHRVSVSLPACVPHTHTRCPCEWLSCDRAEDDGCPCSCACRTRRCYFRASHKGGGVSRSLRPIPSRRPVPGAPALGYRLTPDGVAPAPTLTPSMTLGTSSASRSPEGAVGRPMAPHSRIRSKAAGSEPAEPSEEGLAPSQPQGCRSL